MTKAVPREIVKTRLKCEQEMVRKRLKWEQEMVRKRLKWELEMVKARLGWDIETAENQRKRYVDFRWHLVRSATRTPRQLQR